MQRASENAHQRRIELVDYPSVSCTYDIRKDIAAALLEAGNEAFYLMHVSQYLSTKGCRQDR